MAVAASKQRTNAGAHNTVELLVDMLRKEPTTSAYVTERNTVSDIRIVSRKLWYNIFDQSLDQDRRHASYLASRMIFELDAEKYHRLETGVKDWPKPIFEAVAHKIPDGKHLVIALMCRGEEPAAVVNSLLAGESRSLGFAFVGFSRWNYWRDLRIQPVPEWYTDRVHIPEEDVAIIKKNVNNQILLVDDYMKSGRTIIAVEAALRDLGVRRINRVIDNLK